MKAKLISLLLTLATGTATMYADGYSVTGTIIDAVAQEPCVNVLYHIYGITDTIHPIINNISDINGNFIQKINKTGQYILKAEYLGLSPVKIPFQISNSTPNVNLGTIRMQPYSEKLQEVVVTTKRPLVMSDGANLTYNAEEDPAASNSTVLELLRRVPMVTVDGEDNIRVNGTKDFKIYLNGHSNPMFDSEPQQVLKAMPASSIVKIEVITEPGAKYEAEGTGGILNIITQSGSSKNIEDGYAGTLNAGFGVQSWDLGAFLRAKKNKITASANVNYSNGHLFKRKAFSGQTIRHEDGSRQEYTSTSAGNDYDYVGGNLSLSWEPNEINLFTITLNANKVAGNQNLSPGINTFYDSSENIIQKSQIDNDADFNRQSASINTSYQHNFNNEGNSLTLSYQFAHGNTALDILQRTQDLMISNALIHTSNIYNHYFTNEHTGQADWAIPLTQKHLIEVGAKAVFRHNKSNNTQYDEITKSIKSTLSENTLLTQFQDIIAAYAAYTGHYNKLTLRTGLRYEYTHMGINFRTGNYNDFSNNLNDIVPDVAISYSLSPISTWRLAYNMRIARPDVSQINPAEFEVLPNHIRMGNPNLSSQKAHNISIAYSQYGSKLSWNLRLAYHFINNMISEYVYEKNGILYETNENIGKKDEFSLDGFLSFTPSSRLQLGLNGTLSWVNFSLPNAVPAQHGWQGNLGADISYTMPADFRLSVYGGWAGRQYNVQGWFNGWHYYGIGISKNMLKDRLELSVSAQNMFEKHTHFNGKTITSSSVFEYNYKGQNWNVGLSIKWNFGSLKSQVKKTNANIDNSDSAKTGNSQPGGI